MCGENGGNKGERLLDKEESEAKMFTKSDAA